MNPSTKIDREHRLALITAGICTKCRKPRESEPGHTSDQCAFCADVARTAARNRKRKLLGIPLDAPVKPGKRGPRTPREAGTA